MGTATLTVLYLQGKLCKPATAVSLLIAVGLTGMMGLRWQRSGRFMPAGVVTILSAVMVVFYIWNLQHFKEPLTRPGGDKVA